MSEQVKAREIVDGLGLYQLLDGAPLTRDYRPIAESLTERIAAALTTAYEAGLERSARIIEQPFSGIAHTEEERWRVRLVNQLAREIRAAKETK